MPAANASPVWSRSLGFHQSLSNPGGKAGRRSSCLTARIHKIAPIPRISCLIPNPPLSARRLGLELLAGDVGRDVAHKFLKVIQALQPVNDYRVIDLDVIMHEYVAEPDGLAHRDSQLSCEDPVLSEQPDGVAVVGRRPPAFCCTDVLRDIDASFNGSDEGVLHAPQPDGILTALVAGPRFLPEDGSVVGDAPEQPQDTIFVYHGLPVPAGDTGRELPMRAGDARELVEVNLPGSGLPPDPGDGIILEEQPAACRYPPG